MAALTSASFTSSVVTTLDSWRAFVNHDPRQVTLLAGEELDRLTEGERRAYDDMRTDYHAVLPALKTPILDRTVNKGLLFMRLNRGLQTGHPVRHGPQRRSRGREDHGHPGARPDRRADLPGDGTRR